PATLDLADLYQRYSSWEWRYGETPKFDLEFETRFPWGEIQVGLRLQRGTITQATVYSDAMNPQLIQELAAALHGAVLDPDAIAGRFKDVAGSSQVEDFRDWLVEQVARI